MKIKEIICVDEGAEKHPLEGAYMTDHAGIRYRDKAGEIGVYDPQHPRVIKRLRNGDLVRVDH